MKNVKSLSRMLCIAFILTGFNVLVLGQSEDRNQLATVNGIGSGVRFEVAAPHSAVTLTVAAPDGQVFSKEFQAGTAPEFRLTDAKGERWPEGQYTYELRLTPIFAAGVREALVVARAK